jgi:hypothetical protein
MQLLKLVHLGPEPGILQQTGVMMFGPSALTVVVRASQPPTAPAVNRARSANHPRKPRLETISLSAAFWAKVVNLSIMIFLQRTRNQHAGSIDTPKITFSRILLSLSFASLQGNLQDLVAGNLSADLEQGNDTKDTKKKPSN